MANPKEIRAAFSRRALRVVLDALRSQAEVERLTGDERSARLYEAAAAGHAWLQSEFQASDRPFGRPRQKGA